MKDQTKRNMSPYEMIMRAKKGENVPCPFCGRYVELVCSEDGIPYTISCKQCNYEVKG